MRGPAPPLPRARRAGTAKVVKTDRVLVALDLDAHAEELVGEAKDLASRLSAELVLLTVLPLKPSVDADVLLHPAAHPATQKVLADAEAKVQPRLQALARSARAHGLKVSAQLAHGDVADAILHVARKLDAGLIVMGTHGRRGIARVALGSVAESVIREAPVPVVAVRAGARPEKARVAFHEVDLEGEG